MTGQNGGAQFFDALGDVQSDSLLALIAMANADPRPDKIDVGVGVYRDGVGNTPILRAVKAAEKLLWEQQQTKSYIGGFGDKRYTELLRPVVLGRHVTALFEADFSAIAAHKAAMAAKGVKLSYTAYLIKAAAEAMLARLSAEDDPGVVVLASSPADGKTYGRVILGEGDHISKMVEFKDANEAERAVKLCNSGMKFPQHRSQQRYGKDFLGGDPDCPAGIANLCTGRIDKAASSDCNLARAINEIFAGGGERVAGLALLEQRQAERFLQCGDAPSNRGLTDPQRPACRQRASSVGDCQEIFEVVPVEHRGHRSGAPNCSILRFCRIISQYRCL